MRLTPPTDFADFADVPSSASSFVSSAATAASSAAARATGATGAREIPYTKWYRVWERTSAKDFQQEAMILPFIIFVVILHAWGRRKNRRMANTWAKAHTPALQKEFAVVGFTGESNPTADEVSADGLLQSSLAEKPIEILKEKTGQEYATYASGRQNTAFVDVKLTLYKRYNPMTLIIESVLALLFDSFTGPLERMEATSYSFDGREKDLVPVATHAAQEDLEQRVKSLKSTYDGFVWAVVHKSHMRKLRDERYDVSLTFTKDNAKLPNWVTVMSESAEITDTLLTQDLIKAIEQAGEERFECLVVTDQPLEKPKTYVTHAHPHGFDHALQFLTLHRLQETVPRKRVFLSTTLPSNTDPSVHLPTLPLFSYFLRLPDQLASSAKFRPEVMRKVRATRDEQIRQLRKADDEEKAEERKTEADKKKKTERDAKLRLMSPSDQKKFLDKEREKDARKMGKKQSMRA
jgi:hypothetical protein